MSTTDSSQLDDRTKEVLRYLVQRYLQDGQPVGSGTLANNAALPYSPATIRNVMANLKDIGFLISPHTSAGRIPSQRGMRFFIEQLLVVTPPTETMVNHMQSGLQCETPAEVQSAAARVVSQLTQYVGFVAIPPPRKPVIHRLRFVKLSSSRLLAVMITTDGDVLNRIFVYNRDVSERELNMAAGVFNRHFSGLEFSEAQQRLQKQMLEIREKISSLLRRLLDKVEKDTQREGGVLQIAGEMNLLKEKDLSKNMKKLEQLYDLLEKKKELMRLLLGSDKAKDVRVFIGSESGLSALEECSLVFSSCGSEDNDAVGLIGVVGPKRMRYNQVIPTVDVAARLLRGVLDNFRLS